MGDALLLVSGTMWIFTWPLRRHNKLPWYTVVSFMLFLLAYLFEGLFSGAIEDKNSLELTKFLVSFYFLNYLISDSATNNFAVEILAAAYVASGVVNATTGITDVFGLTNFDTWLNVATVNDYEYGGRAHGLTMHPNHMGLHCATALFLIVATIRKNDTRVKRAFALAASLILLLGILISGSRGALLSIFIMGLLIGFISFRHLYRSKVLLPLVFIASGLAIIATLNQDQQLFEAWNRLMGGADVTAESNLARIQSYSDAWQDFLNHPLAGSGYASIAAAHNIYLQILQSGGLIGTVGFLLYFAAPIWHVRRLLKSKQMDNLTLGVVSSIGIFLINGLVTNTIYVRSALIPMGLLWALIRLYKRRQLKANGISNNESAIMFKRIEHFSVEK